MFLCDVLKNEADLKIRAWLSGPLFGQRIVAVAVQLCAESLIDARLENSEESSMHESRWSLLGLALSTGDFRGGLQSSFILMRLQMLFLLPFS